MKGAKPINKKVTMQDMQAKFSTMPTSSNVVVIDGISYTVVSHYTGNKDVDKVIRALAEKQAITEMNNNETNTKISA